MVLSQSAEDQNKKDAKRKYPKCVPLAKARRMTEGQRRSAVKEKEQLHKVLVANQLMLKHLLKEKKLTWVVLWRRMGLK